MRVLIVDDEKLARERLRELLSDIGGYNVVGEAMNGSEAIEKTGELNPDLLLMDIRMPGMDGLEAAMHLMGMENPPSVIFTTAYDQHALDAFEVNAVDYLLKPIRKDRLANALVKAHKLTAKQLQEVNQSREEPNARTHISVHMRGNIRLVPVPEVIYFLADSKYVVIRTPEDEFLIEDSLVNLEKEFGDQFLRIHRNALVTQECIRGLDSVPGGRVRLVLEGTDIRPEVSRRKLSTIRQILREMG